jgi:hypothetical protein
MIIILNVLNVLNEKIRLKHFEFKIFVVIKCSTFIILINKKQIVRV